MDFTHSEKVVEYLSRLNTFMDEHIYPNERAFRDEVEAGDRWEPSDLIEGLKARAKAAGLWSVALCGGKGGTLAKLADEVLCVASSGVTARIQEGHIMIIHALCQIIEEKMAE